MTVCTVTFFPQGKAIEVEKGVTVLEASSHAGFSINNLCGGDGVCGQCKMLIKEGRVTGGISAKLTLEEVKKGAVLACLAIVEENLVVEIPADTLAQEKRRSDKEAARFKDLHPRVKKGEGYEFSPLIKKLYLELENPSLANNTADHQRLCTLVKQHCGASWTRADLDLIRTLPALLRANEYKVTATLGMHSGIVELINIEGGNSTGKNCMAVVDMGTTTMVAHLVDVCKNRTLDARACFNSQGVYGREVTTRIITAEKKGGAELQRLLVADINQLVAKLARDNGVALDDIYAVVCAGNTAMMHFLLDLPVGHIRRTPYVAASVEPPVIRASDVGIKINSRGLLYTLPGISAWVGSDITAGILATALHKKKELCLLVDIGTNGEVVVGNGDWMISCSASAGPALEGASVECGLRAEAGAIEKVRFENGEIRYETIGGVPPKGLCGSGIIDAVSALLEAGLINRSGKFIQEKSGEIESHGGIKRYVFAHTGGKPVYITEADIENIITAKAAIYAAMRILLHRLELEFNDIRTFFIAGGFGNYINLESAVNIGLIPGIPRERIVFAGNTSLQGAKIAALYQKGADEILQIERNTTYYDLMGADDYIEEFTKAMFLPHTDIESFRSAAA